MGKFKGERSRTVSKERSVTRPAGKYRRLMSHTAVIAMGQMGSKILVYLLVRLYTSVLTKEEYSIASNITDIATLLIPLVSLGIGEAVFRFAMDKNYEAREVFSQGFAILGMGLGLLPLLVLVLYNIPYFTPYVWLIVGYVLASAIHTNCSQFIRSQAMFRLYALQGILNTLFTIGFNLFFLLGLKIGVVGYVISVAVADLCTSVFLMFAARLWRYIDFGCLKKSTFRSMLIYSLPLIPTTISWWVTNVSDRYMITFMKSDAVNGLYAAAYKIPTLLMVLIGIFNNAWKYSAVSERGSGEHQRFFSNVYRSFGASIFCVSGGIVVFSKVLSRMMFGAEFRAAWVYIPILTLAMAFSALSSFTGTIFIVEKKSRLSLLTALAGAVLNVALNLLLIPRFDHPDTAAMGAALATFASYFVMFLLRLYFSRRLIGYDPALVATNLNFLIVTALALVVTLEVKGWIPMAAAGLLLLALVNLPTLIRSVKKLLWEKRAG